ncbi:hypothetical protein RIR_jg23702.t1 [Rhizophagus irregularis DAOM 181602=DAOM 197198]|nr:hypothetical protein RIR_jg23702.t1 [Rhizophagus irregularis DAOM 181602=DAOM 197198]
MQRSRLTLSMETSPIPSRVFFNLFVSQKLGLIVLVRKNVARDEKTGPKCLSKLSFEIIRTPFFSFNPSYG